MKLRLTQDGFGSYTGQMGVVFFENGLSTADVKVSDAVRMSAVMKCEWEDGTSPSVTQSILDNAHTPASTIVKNELTGTAALRAETVAAEEMGKSDRPATEPPRIYTEEELSAVADKEGIKGLRKIATSLGIKGGSVVELIKEILEKNPKV